MADTKFVVNWEPLTDHVDIDEKSAIATCKINFQPPPGITISDVTVTIQITQRPENSKRFVIHKQGDISEWSDDALPLTLVGTWSTKVDAVPEMQEIILNIVVSTGFFAGVIAQEVEPGNWETAESGTEGEYVLTVTGIRCRETTAVTPISNGIITTEASPDLDVLVSEKCQ